MKKVWNDHCKFCDKIFDKNKSMVCPYCRADNDYLNKPTSLAYRGAEAGQTVAMNAEIDRLNKEIEELKAKLEEPKKPKLKKVDDKNKTLIDSP